jgi:DNA-binding winged helix-turn-helix (wHTH) protein/tetratricopeptide (TPR) repeat protein
VNESAYRFGEFHLIPARHELWCSGRRVSVQPKALEILVYLVQHRDRTVGRDELISAVWGRTDITDNVLSQIVARTRQAVGDTTKDQHAIRTVPRFGYRWIHDVEEVSAKPDRMPEQPAARSGEPVMPLSPPPSVGLWSRRSAAAATLALLGVIGLAGWALTRYSTTDHPGLVAATSVKTQVGDISTWSDTQRLQRLHGAIASNQFDLARTIYQALSDQDHTRPEVRYEAADLALKEGRFEESLSAFKALLFDLGEHGPPTLLGPALYGAGQAEFRRGLLDAAEPYFKLAIEVLPRAGPEGRVTLGLTWSSLGRLYSMRKAFEKAEHAYAQARMILDGASDTAALAQLESNVGVTLIARYRYAEALPRFQRAADLAAMTKDANAEARARMNLVNAQLVLLQPAAALESESRLRSLRDLVGNPVLAADVDLIRAKALTANGRLTEASLTLQAEKARPTPDDETLAAIRYIVSADLAFAQGAFDAGARSAHALVTLPWDSSEDHGVTAYALWQWLESSKAMGDTQGMADAAAATEAKSRALPNEPTVGLYAALARAETADGRGDTAGAQSEFEHALVQAEAARIPFDLVRVVAGYTQFLLRHGLDTEAGVVAERIAGWAERDYTASLVQLSVYHAIGSEAWRSALARTRTLAGERKIPAVLIQPPSPLAMGDKRVLLAGPLL